MAAQLDGKTRDEAIEAILNDPERAAEYLATPWKLELDRVMWDHNHPEGVARAICGVIEDWPVDDRELLRKVTNPVLLICVEGDDIHPVELGRILGDLLPNSELVVYESQMALFEQLPALVEKVSAFLAADE
jgi:pimeloyl-ACP methyl ester carboxylesterase